MQKSLILFIFCWITTISFLMAQPQVLSNAPYEKEWRQIDSLLQQQLPESAKNATLALQAKAEEVSLPNHLLKTQLYLATIQAQLNEDGHWAAIQSLNTQLENSNGPQRALLSSLLAEAYFNYAQQNNWQLSQRTQTTEEPTSEESTWTLPDFYRRATTLYLAALTDKSTRKLEWTDFSPLIVPGFDTESLRPTLYDILLHRTISYLQNNDALIGDASYQNSLQDLSLLEPVEAFINYKWVQTTPQSRIEQILRLFQEALSWRQTQGTTAALFDLNLLRLQYVYDQLQNPAKETAYRMALEKLVANTAGTDLQAMPLWALARWHYQQGQGYQAGRPDQEQQRWQLATSMRIAEQITTKFSDSFEAKQAQSLITQLTRPSLNFNIESVYLPNDPGLVSIEYQNMERVYFRIIKLAEEDYFFEQYENDWLTKLVKKPQLRNWQVNLPDAGDYHRHRTETSFQGLKRGVYCLLASTRPDFPAEDAYTTQASFWVSELGVLTQSDARGEGNILMVVNRRSGQPVADAKVELWIQGKGLQARKKVLSTHQTNRLGQVNRLNKHQRRQIYVGVSTAEDRLYSLDRHYLSGSIRPPRPLPGQLQFFLDRAIYRPGQTVYFKGLLTQKTKQTSYPTIQPQQPVTVSLYDANRQVVSELELTTNAWGSINGQFTLPSGGLPGTMQLRSNYGSYSFQVEAYKRPRFEVRLDELATAAKLGDTVRISGNARAYAGPAIGDAQVTYTVTRRIFYPWFYRYGRFPSQKADVLATGELKSNEQGEFEFTFPAISLSSNQGAPYYEFSIQVDVTDETGETRSASKSLRLAEFPVQLSITTTEQQDRNQPLKLELNSQNYDQQATPCQVQLSAFRLDGTETVQVSRYWPKPDTVIISETSFKRDFPYFAYESKEPAQTLIWQESQLLNGKQTQEVDITNWPIGAYLIQLATITPSGDTLRKSQRITINDWQANEFSKQAPLHFWAPQSTFQPGETLDLQLGASVSDIGVYIERLRQNEELDRSWVHPQPATRLSYAFTEEDRGTLIYNFQHFYRNRRRTRQLRFQVPWTNKKLQIRTETFREKLSPGNPERWRLRILNSADQGLEAEVLASMYDASLDQFKTHTWQLSPEPRSSGLGYWQTQGFSGEQFYLQTRWQSYTPSGSRNYPSLFPLRMYSLRNMLVYDLYPNTYESVAFGVMSADAPSPKMARNRATAMETEAAPNMSTGGSTDNVNTEVNTAVTTNIPPPLRTNLQETAFFLPELYSATDGSLEIAFNSPEALTRWKLQLLAHDKDLAYALHTEEVVTQKELMILPNFPRFVRTGDEIRLAAKVSNLSEQTLSTTATLELFDLATEQPLTGWLASPNDVLININAEASGTAYWQLQVPKDFTGSLGYRVYIRSASFSDGEEGFWPVLSNKVLVTESQPIFVAGGNKASFTLDRLTEDKANRVNHQLRFDMVANPVWEAIKALPYLQEYPYNCTEQLINRWFANSLALHIASQEPQLEAYYAAWAKDSTALQSPLAQQNGNKTALLTETPWVRDALAESEQRRQIRKLFNTSAREAEQANDWQKILQRQATDGSFSWFPGGYANTYITQYVVEQFARLRQLTNNPNLNADFVKRALTYLDKEMTKRYQKLEEKGSLKSDHFGPTVAQYLYVRSLFSDVKLEIDRKIYTYWLQQAADHWTQQPLQTQAYAAIALQRQQRTAIAGNIFQSLRERSRYQTELGRYWPGDAGWYWYEHPLETHCLLMEAYRELGGTSQEQDELRLWLLRNKETNRWETTKATAAAIHALLQDGISWQEDDKPLRISFPQSKAATNAVAEAQQSAEAGTGYFQLKWPATEVKAELAQVEVRNPNSVPAWGGLYWQYFSPIEDIEVADNTPLQIDRKLYTRVSTPQGEELRPVTGTVAVGDKVTVRLVVRTDRDMEFVHLKDLRAAGLEPIQVISGYRYQGGLGYYQSNTDLATHFFFDYLPKGEYVLEYDLRVFHAGDFSGGMASLQCMYAPKFAGHSQGERLKGVAE